MKIQNMKAAILVEQNKKLEIEDVELPNELSFGQILVKVEYSGICGSQIGEIEGIKGPDNYLPHLLGHEGSGIVIDIGPGVKNVKVDDRVVLHWREGKGINSDLPKYKWKNKYLNAGWVTTFNEYAIISENRCTPIPKNTDLKIASLFGCAVLTGFGVIENNAKLKIGESVVVFGSGGIGLNIIQAAKLVSANPIIALDIYDNRLDLAKSMGATHTINTLKNDPEKTINRIISGNNLDLFVDNTGNPKIIELGYKIICSKGRVVLVGVPSKNNNINIYSLPIHFGKKLVGSHGGNGVPEDDIPRYLSIFDDGKSELNKLLTDEFELSDINNAIKLMRNGEISGRCLINMSK